MKKKTNVEKTREHVEQRKDKYDVGDLFCRRDAN